MKRSPLTRKTTDSECIWYSPACQPSAADRMPLFDEPQPKQTSLLDAEGAQQ